MRQQHGLTLVELMITLVIAAILLGVALPSMQTMTLHTRSSSGIAQLQQDLIYARQIATAYQNSVTMCPLNSANQCDGKWGDGYQLFIDADNDNQFDSGEEVLIKRGSFNQDDTINGATAYRFSSDGFLSSSSTIRYCAGSKNSEFKKQLTISATGIVTEADATANCS